jgi:hypothetical protein
MKRSEEIYTRSPYTRQFWTISGFNWGLTGSLKGQQRVDPEEGESRAIRWKRGLTFEAGTGISVCTPKWS